MGNGHSVYFGSGPYRGWYFAVDEFAHNGAGRMFVQLETASRPVTPRTLAGSVMFHEDMPGYDVTRRGLCGGVAELEAALTFVLDATAEALDGPTPDGQGKRWAHWSAIVDAGRAARDGHAARYGDRPEPAFDVVGAGVSGATV